MEQHIDIVRKFRQLKVVALGDLMLDVYDYCTTKDSKPIPSEDPIKHAYKVQSSLKILGGAGNVAANLAALGVTTSLIGLTGHDGDALTLQILADKIGISHSLISDTSRATTAKMRIYIDNEYQLRRDEEDTHKASPEITATVLKKFLLNLEDSAAVILSDYNKGLFTEALAHKIIIKCKQKAIPVVVDMKPANMKYFRGVDIVALNAVEATILQPTFGRHTHSEHEVRTLYELLGSKNLIVTLGDRGICGFDGHAYFQVPAYKVKAADTVGCGDTARVCITLGYTLNMPLREAAILANAAGAIVAQKNGTATLTQQELISFLKKKQD